MDFTKYSDIVYQVIGAALSVYNTQGRGLLEPIYNESLSLELMDIGIDNQAECEVDCYYKHHKLQKKYRVDILVGKDICVELKSVSTILPEHRSQLFNYLRLTRIPVGILINFGGASLQGERYGFDIEANFCHRLDRNMQPYEKIFDN
jgi:GxxExxY protein